MAKNILIVGGTSGLGLALAEIYANNGHHVVIAGRKDPENSLLRFFPFSINADSKRLSEAVHELVSQIEPINTLIYAAGYYQEGHIDELSEKEICEMQNVGLMAPLFLIRKLKQNPEKPLKVMLITSSSQVIPREKEPVYAAVKAGLGMLGNSLGLDPAIGKVLVIAPAGMDTPFWSGERDCSTFLDPKWVAEEIIKLSSGPFKYRFARIWRNPARVEIIETRQSPA